MTGSVEDKFEYPVLTKVIGTLKYSSLKTIKDELKTNAACIHSELRGGGTKWTFRPCVNSHRVH